MTRWLPILTVAGCLFGPSPARADGITRYAETVWLNENGSAHVDIAVDLAAGTAGPLRLPLVWEGLTSMRLSGIDRATGTVTSAAGQPQLSIDFDGRLAAPATLRVSGDVPEAVAAMRSPAKAFGDRTFTYRFVNSTPGVFPEVVNELILPAGYVVTSIDGSEPPATESSTAPPFALVSRDGRHGVSIAAGNVGLADAASVTFRFKSRQAPLALLLALLLASVGYLIGFRHLVTRPAD